MFFPGVNQPASTARGAGCQHIPHPQHVAVAGIRRFYDAGICAARSILIAVTGFSDGECCLGLAIRGNDGDHMLPAAQRCQKSRLQGNGGAAAGRFHGIVFGRQRVVIDADGYELEVSMRAGVSKLDNTTKNYNLLFEKINNIISDDPEKLKID